MWNTEHCQTELDCVCVYKFCRISRSLHPIAILSCGVRKAASRNFVVSVLYVEFCLSYHVKTLFFLSSTTSTKLSSFSPIACVKPSIPRLWQPLISRIARKPFISRIKFPTSLSFSPEDRLIVQTRRLDYLTRRALTD